MINTNPAQGMRDLGPRETELRNYLKGKIREVYRKFGFTQVETPSVENIQLLSRGEGGENEKLIFKILKRGRKLDLSKPGLNENDLVDFGLRFDLTVPLGRYYANNRGNLPERFKVIQMGSVWRAERPQKGRYRQFTQCDIDIIGVKEATAEVELIMATSEALLSLGFRDFRVRINDRRILEHLADHCGFSPDSFGNAFIILDKLDKIGSEGVRKEMEESGFESTATDRFLDIVGKADGGGQRLEVLNETLPGMDKEFVENLRFIMASVASQAKGRYELVYDLSLVRGMGYYTGPIFEIESTAFQSSIAGGGRYDKMIGKMLKKYEEIPACGFSIGFERILAILEEQGFQIPNEEKRTAVLYEKNLGEKEFIELLSVADQLREKGSIVSVELKKKNFNRQLEQLKEAGMDSFATFRPGEDLAIRPLD